MKMLLLMGNGFVMGKDFDIDPEPLPTDEIMYEYGADDDKDTSKEDEQ